MTREEITTAVLGVLVFLGFACQLIGIYKGTSSIQEFRQQFREWAKNWFESLAHRNNTGTATVELPMIRLRASGTTGPPPNATLATLTAWTHESINGISRQTAAVLEELDKLKEEIESEQTQRNEADKRLSQMFTKAEHAAWFILFGTLFLALAELASRLWPGQ